MYTVRNAHHGSHILWYNHQIVIGLPACWVGATLWGNKPVEDRGPHPAIGWDQLNILLKNSGRSLLPKRGQKKL